MSYILEALKRADAERERERGQVPGLHAQPAATDLPAAPSPTPLPRAALIGGGLLTLMVVAALAWRMGADAHAPLPAPQADAGTPGPPPASPPAPDGTRPASPATPAPVLSAAPVPAPSQAPEPAPAPLPAPLAPAPRVTAPPPPARADAPVAAPVVGPIAAPVTATQPASAVAPPGAARIPLLAELPAGLRQQLPALAVGGSVYSDDPAARFILLNGEVVKEGARPAPGLTVERIEARSAVLRFQGQRFRLPL